MSKSAKIHLQKRHQIQKRKLKSPKSDENENKVPRCEEELNTSFQIRILPLSLSEPEAQLKI